ncbi:MAG: uroporphyrinogen-III synthase [Candidatus Eremiobacteraeota bacterium]|nr:uroporphyrinogen-III synthase [Candidatus Eremiobacteraeota bacterium]
MVTRSAQTADDLVHLLQARGAQVDVVPLIRIGPPPDESSLQRALADAGSFDWIAFTSVNGVQAFALRCQATLASEPQIAAVGSATARAIAVWLHRGADVVASAFSAEGLAQSLIAKASAGARVLVVAAQAARPALSSMLQSAGLNVTRVAAYTTIEEPPGDLLVHLAQADVVTLASASAVRSLVRGLKRGGRSADLRGKLVACVGPVTFREAMHYALPVEVVADPSTSEALVEALCRYYRGA